MLWPVLYYFPPWILPLPTIKFPCGPKIYRKQHFCSRQGLMEFMTMPFGQTCHSNSNFPENHGNRTGLKLKPGKCYLFQPEVTFLGHVISHKGVTPNPDNTVKLVNWPPPSNVTEVRSFVGFATYYRRFVKNFSEIAHPLTNLTKKGTQVSVVRKSVKQLSTN